MKSEDLLATVFPDQVACAENLVGEREVPDHPLVAQTLDDCLHEAMDADGWLALLRGLESGEMRIVARDLTAPSPFAAEALNARPYAFLDDAPLEERRTQAVMSRRYADADSADDLGRLDPDAIESVREQAWPQVRNADEMHEALMGLGFVTDAEARACGLDGAGCARALAQVRDAPRALDRRRRLRLWVAAERLPQVQALHPDAAMHAGDRSAGGIRGAGVVARGRRARTRALAPDRARPDDGRRARATLGLPRAEIDVRAAALETEGYVMRGRFTPRMPNEDEWCERHLLARIHRYTIGRLRREIEPVEPRDFMRFLLDWQRVSKDTRVSGPDALAGVLAQLEGFEAPAGAWESELLPARVSDYSIAWLDDLCTAGPHRVDAPAQRGHERRRRRPRGAGARDAHRVAAAPAAGAVDAPGRRAARRRSRRCPRARRRSPTYLREHGASFFDELVGGAHLLRTELEDALAELVARGRVHCDSFAGLRALLVPQSKRPSAIARRGRRASLFGIEDAGRWTLTRRGRTSPSRQRKPNPRPSNTSRARCCAATAWCAGACSSAKRPGCRHGASCCASTTGWKRAAKSAAAVSSPA